MNASKMKFAKERLNKIFREKSQAMATQFKAREVTLTPKQKLEALKGGDVVFRKASDMGSGYYISDFLSFSAEAGNETIKVEKEKALAELTAEYDRVLDELMLGDEEEALELLKAFASLK